MNTKLKYSGFVIALAVVDDALVQCLDGEKEKGSKP